MIAITTYKISAPITLADLRDMVERCADAPPESRVTVFKDCQASQRDHIPDAITITVQETS